jgi:hypothetical protein
VPNTAQEIGNSHGYLCPKCKTGLYLSIAATVWARLLPDGTDNSDSDTEWDENSTAKCENLDCSQPDGPTMCWCGKVSDLLTVEVTE